MATQDVYRDDPKLKDLVYELKEVDWNQLGIQLNVPRHILRNIDRENPGNESRKLSEVLQYWIDNAEPTASWEKILEALQRIGGHKNIITAIQLKYMISPQPQPCTESTSASDESEHPILSRSSTAEGGVSLGSVSARPIHSLEEQLSKFPVVLLDSPCANSHLVKLSQSIAEWQDLAPYMQLTLAEERGILTASPQVTPARQCTEMFRIWRERFSKNASYRCLITTLHEANRVDLIDELRHIVTLEQIPTHQPHTQPASHDLGWYGCYLKKQYLEELFTQQVSANKWLPSPTQKIFNLAIIKKEKIQRGRVDDEFVHKTIRGQIDDILQKKSPIELKNIFKNIKGERKVILIDGAPGSGKSTLTVHICQQWGRGELYNEFTVIVLVQLRDPKVQSAQSIIDLLPCENRAMAEQATTEILAAKGSSVLWILDGFDELPSHVQDDSTISTLIKPKLHQENPLSKTAVIVTSRPISSDNLCIGISSRIEVLGFTAEEQRLFFTECLNNDTKAVETLMERLSSNPAMEGSCYLPLNASIVAHLYQTNGSLPSTIYGIFSSFVQHCLSRCLHERQGIPQKLASFESLDGLPDDLYSFFEQLCKLAFTGTRDNKVTFSSGDIEALGCSDEICELGLLQAVPSIVSHGRSVYHNFLHLSIQEMLAAVHISRMPASRQISTFDSMFNDARFSAVLQFYAAITKFRTSRPPLSLVPRFLCPVPASVYDLVRKIIRKNSKAFLVSLLNCLYEAQDTALCKYVGEQMRNSIPFLDKIHGDGWELALQHISLLPQDCLSIGYFLASIAVNYKREFSVCLYSCSLGDTGIKILMQSLCRSLDPHSEITGHLDMGIRFNEITGEGASFIAEVLRTTRALRRLHLWDDPIGDEGLQYIAEAMTSNASLIELNLSGCSLTITKENGPTLTEMLQRNKTLKMLNLSRNNIFLDKGLQYIAEALTTNTSLIELNLSCCSLRITEENGPTFTEMLQRNKTLRKLDLSWNEAISDNQASFIMEGLKKNTTLKTLYLHGCSFTNESVRLIRRSTSTCKIIQQLGGL